MIKLKSKLDKEVSKVNKAVQSKKSALEKSTDEKTSKVKEESRGFVKDLVKTMVKESGVNDSYRARKEKMQREKAIAVSKAKGIPLAPNGLAYDEEELRAAMKKNKWTQEQAIKEFSKLEKYTKTNIEAPNGSFYEDNDIKYLTSNGYTKESAIEYLSKCPKYKKVTAGDVKASNQKVIKEVSRKFVEQQLDVLMDGEINKIIKQYGVSLKWDEKTKEKVRAIIRGEANVIFSNDKIVKDAVELTERELNKYFDKNMKQLSQRAFGSAEARLQGGLDRIKNIETKYLALSEEDVMNALNGKLDKRLNSMNGVSSISNKLGSLDKAMGEYGLSLGLQGEFQGALSGLTKNISQTLASQLQPQLAKQITVTKEISKRLTRYKEEVAAIKQKALARVNEWKQEAMSKIKKEEQRLVKSAMGTLSKQIGKIKLGF